MYEGCNMTPEQETIIGGLEPDAFDLAFEAAAGGSDVSIDVLDTQTADDSKAESETKPAASTTPVEGTGEPSEGTRPEDEQVAAKEETKPVAPDLAAVVAAKTRADNENADRKTADAIADAERKETARIAAEQRAVQEQLTADEQAVIDLADKEFPEVSKAYTARERVLITKLTNSFETKLAETKAELTQQIVPVARTIAANEFETAVLKAHSDAFDILGKVDAWVATKPSFLQKQFNDILDHAVGGPSATIELLTLFKDETGSAQPPSSSANEKASEEAHIQKKLQSQEGVQSRSTQKSAAVDPEDFDGAYEKFAATSA